ncbi:MAG TPA: pyridoxamine 5'-phosphate oxidase family protein, partial [Solirubrobacteraceae bacterium]|nr:pyridoxamine 5'-phosphate oxidase family protein [Solirubrobacteraceae bacterium]
EVGLLFISFEHGRRLRVDGTASVDPDDELRPVFRGAQAVVRVRARAVFPNCPRYIHRYELVERSSYVPRAGAEPPVPDWKRRDWARDVLPAGDPARSSS